MYEYFANMCEILAAYDVVFSLGGKRWNRWPGDPYAALRIADSG
ncbi:hypothetical protein [Sphaerimonospora mesophila]